MAVSLVVACAVAVWAFGVWRGLTARRGHPRYGVRVRFPYRNDAAARQVGPAPRVRRSAPPMPLSAWLPVGIGAGTLAVLATAQDWPAPFPVYFGLSALHALAVVVWRLLASSSPGAPTVRP